jgi:hypothetical protein
MTAHIPEEFFLKLIDRSPFVLMGNTVPPKNSNDDEEDEEDEEEEDENRGDEPMSPSNRIAAYRDYELAYLVWPVSGSLGVFFSTCGVILAGLSLPGTPRGPSSSR